MVEGKAGEHWLRHLDHGMQLAGRSGSDLRVGVRILGDGLRAIDPAGDRGAGITAPSARQCRHR